MYTEEQLIAWTKPASDTEKAKTENAISMIKDAVDNYDWSVSGINNDIKVRVKGSYSCNTNVKKDSDVDLYVLFNYYNFPIDLQQNISPDYIGGDGIKFSVFREELGKALKNKFQDSLRSGNKAFHINSNTYRLDADVVPVVRAIYKPDTSKEGICFYSRDNKFIVNYPEQNSEKGNIKNQQTNNYYKKIVRILKNIRNDLDSDVSHQSFMIESILYNLSTPFFISDSTYLDTTRRIVEQAYPMVTNNANSLHEVNDIKKLFSDKQSWQVGNATDFLQRVYERLK